MRYLGLMTIFSAILPPLRYLCRNSESDLPRGVLCFPIIDTTGPIIRFGASLICKDMAGSSLRSRLFLLHAVPVAGFGCRVRDLCSVAKSIDRQLKAWIIYSHAE